MGDSLAYTADWTYAAGRRRHTGRAAITSYLSPSGRTETTSVAAQAVPREHDSQRQDLIAGQDAELAGRWLHLRVTTRPYPIRMWAEAHVHITS